VGKLPQHDFLCKTGKADIFDRQLPSKSRPNLLCDDQNDATH
jgi:hypothetical protein